MCRFLNIGILFIYLGHFSCLNKENLTSKNIIDSVSQRFWIDLNISNDLAEKSSKWVIIQSRKINYLKGEADGLAGIAIVLENKGKYDSAICYNLLSLQARIKGKDKKKEARSYINLARNYSKLHQTKQERIFLTKAFKSIYGQKDTLELVNILNEFAIYYTAKQNYDSAKIKFEESLYLAKLLKDKNLIACQLENYGNILNQLYQDDSALYYYSLCVPIYNEKMNKSNLASLYNNIALIYWNKDKRDSAIFYLKKGYDETLKFGDKEELQSYLSNLIDYWEEEPDLKKSNTYLHELVDLKDSVFKNNLEDKIANIENQFRYFLTL